MLGILHDISQSPVDKHVTVVPLLCYKQEKMQECKNVSM